MKERLASIVVASSILLGGCGLKDAQAKIPVELPAPTTSTSFLSQEGRLLADLGSFEDYSSWQGLASDQEKLEAFQRRNGLVPTSSFDLPTMGALASETERLQAPPVECTTTEDPTQWSRKHTVQMLSQMDAFSIRYAENVSTREILLDRAKTSDILVQRLNELLHFASCHDVRFNLLAIDRQGFDVRPFDGDSPIPHYAPGQKLQAQHYINNHPKAKQAADVLMSFFADGSHRYAQVIWTESKVAIDGGEVIRGDMSQDSPDTYSVKNHWHGKVAATHHDRIHIEINPNFKE